MTDEVYLSIIRALLFNTLVPYCTDKVTIDSIDVVISCLGENSMFTLIEQLNAIQTYHNQRAMREHHDQTMAN